LDSELLFNSLFVEDIEGKRLNEMPGAEELLTEFHDKFLETCQSIFEFGQAEHEIRKKEVDEFWKCLNEAKDNNTEEATKIIAEFTEVKKKIIDELQNSAEEAVQEGKLNEYSDEVNKLWEKLMSLEVQIVDQLEEIIRDFERNMSDLVSGFVEQVQARFANLRYLESSQFERLQELCIIMLEKVIKNEVGDEFPEDLRDVIKIIFKNYNLHLFIFLILFYLFVKLFIDKDTLVNVLQTSHDMHLLKIDTREDSVISKIKNWMSNMIEHIHEEQEYTRNRKRVMEINRLIDYLRDEIYEPADLQNEQ
jgi:hypothetical protein